MAFWGVEVKPGEQYIREPSPGERIRLTQATLGNYDDVGWSTLECSVGNMKHVRLCALNSTTIMSHLDLEIEEKKNFVLSVLGNSSIHLSGYCIRSHNADHGRKCTKLNIEQVPNDHTNGTDRVNEQGNSKTIRESNKVHTVAPQDHEITLEGNTHRNIDHEQNAVETEGQNNPIITISSNEGDAIQGVEKQIEEAQNCESAYAGEASAHKQTLDSTLKIEHLTGGNADAKMSSNHDKVPSSSRKIISQKCLKSKFQGGHTDGNNDNSLREPFADEDADDVDDHLPITVAFSKRQAAMMNKYKTASTKKVNERTKDPKTVESNTENIPPTQAHEIAQDDIASQNVRGKKSALENEGQNDGADQIVGRTNPTATISDGTALGAANLKGYKEAENCDNLRTGKAPIHKQTLDNRLVVEDLEFGDPDGETASLGKKVYVKYVGMLSDGKVVDPSSTEDCGTHTFKLGAGRVIPGWDQGIDGMRVGGKRKLTIPPALGFGDEGNEDLGIPGNSWLIYEVELTKVMKRVKMAPKNSVKQVKKDPQASVKQS